MRGLYYELNWDQHHKTAFASVSEPPPTGIDDAQWGCGSMWDVDIAEKTVSRGGHAAKQGTRHSRKKVKLVTVDESGSEASGAEDEYEATSNGEEEDDIVRDDEGEESDASLKSFYDDEPKTPSKKKRKRDTTTRSPTKRGAGTPRKLPATRTLVHPTPHSKARRKIAASSGLSPQKRQFAVRPQRLVYAAHDLSHLPRDPWLRAMHVLHVGSRPDALPCREEEFERVLRCVGELLEEGSGGCICEFFLPSLF